MHILTLIKNLNYISLVNLIANKLIVKELIQNDCSKKNLIKELNIILEKEEPDNLGNRIINLLKKTPSVNSPIAQYKNDPRYATAIGIIKYASLNNVDDFISNNQISIIGKIKKFFNRLTNWY